MMFIISKFRYLCVVHREDMSGTIWLKLTAVCTLPPISGTKTGVIKYVNTFILFLNTIYINLFRRMSKKVLIVLQTRKISERRHQCLSITWYGWKCAHGSQLQSYGTRHVFTVNNTKVTEFTYYKHHLFMRQKITFFQIPEEGAKIVGVFRVKKSRFYAKKSYFF
jgi:hypothetical protein